MDFFQYMCAANVSGVQKNLQKENVRYESVWGLEMKRTSKIHTNTVRIFLVDLQVMIRPCFSVSQIFFGYEIFNLVSDPYGLFTETCLEAFDDYGVILISDGGWRLD